MATALPGDIQGNETIRSTFHIVFTHYTYCLSAYVIYGIPSLIVTLKVIVAIMSPKFKTFFGKPFFVLFAHNCIWTVIHFVYDFFTTRLPISGLITGWLTTLPSGRYLTAVYMIQYYLVYMTGYSATFVAVIRAIIVGSPIRGNKVRNLRRCF
ncbi:hypothetical protein GCK32_013328 [Trichostrongylus colubriformis]|uniref:Serpentine receptor class gamma n=1 Tax=Trichostrongylus colubriformis TaxID=6319 RepID=A0AAN8ICP4_TRICO